MKNSIIPTLDEEGDEYKKIRAFVDTLTLNELFAHYLKVKPGLSAVVQNSIIREITNELSELEELIYRRYQFFIHLGGHTQPIPDLSDNDVEEIGIYLKGIDVPGLVLLFIHATTGVRESFKNLSTYITQKIERLEEHVESFY